VEAASTLRLPGSGPDYGGQWSSPFRQKLDGIQDFWTIVTAPVLLNDWLNNVLEVVIPLRWKQYLSIIQWSQDFGWMLGWKCEDVEPGPGEFGDRSGWHYGHSR